MVADLDKYHAEAAWKRYRADLHEMLDMRVGYCGRSIKKRLFHPAANSRSIVGTKLYQSPAYSFYVTSQATVEGVITAH